MKRPLTWAAPAVGAAIILATVSFAGPAEATYTCWNSEDGRHCRETGDSATGRATVRPVDYPTFSGILAAGQILTSYSGEWARAQTLTYQWLRDGADIPGADGETYEITAADTGHTLALRVTGSNSGLKDGVAATLPSPKVSNGNTAEYTALPDVIITGEAPVVDGFSRVGFTLDVINLGTWSPEFVTMQWQADGVDIEGATGDSYPIKVSDLGKRITLKVTGSWPGLESVSKSNTAPVVTGGYIHPGNGELYPVGGTKVGDILGVGPFGWYADGEPMSFLYQWKRDGQPIAGATASTYEIVADDKGHQIAVVVTATAVGYGPNPQSSLYVVIDGDTDPTPVPAVPTATASPSATSVPTATASPAATSVPTATASPAATASPTATATATVTASPAQTPSRTSVPEAIPSPEGSVRIFVPARIGGGDVEPQASVQAPLPGVQFDTTPGTDTGYPAVDSPEQAVSAAAPATPGAGPSVTAAPLADATPGPSAKPSEPVTMSGSQLSTAGDFRPLPLVLTIGGAMLAGALVWFVRPVRAAFVRIATRKRPSGN
ncbi:hypothetical protein [Arthrobacter sp. UYEF20]|uniref:hypothetical protein n=1 Tax=Arthrobacter sp. UYEF20 TaxID=1756363 RepID=UPI0033966F9D